MSEKSEIHCFKKSFCHAWRGIKYAFLNERNFQIEILASVCVFSLIFIFKLKNWEAIILILIVMWVLVIELTNTVVERVVDILKPRIHPYARLIKDLMAAVVLISSIVALVIGAIIFFPYLNEILINLF